MKNCQYRLPRQNVRVNLGGRVGRIIRARDDEKISTSQKIKRGKVSYPTSLFVYIIFYPELTCNRLDSLLGPRLDGIVGADEMQPHFREQIGIKPQALLQGQTDRLARLLLGNTQRPDVNTVIETVAGREVAVIRHAFIC